MYCVHLLDNKIFMTIDAQWNHKKNAVHTFIELTLS